VREPPGGIALFHVERQVVVLICGERVSMAEGDKNDVGGRADGIRLHTAGIKVAVCGDLRQAAS
jgi:hypothetical protein